MGDMGRRTLVLLGLAGMSLCLVFSLLFRRAVPVPPTGTSETDSVVEGGKVVSVDQLVAAEDSSEDALLRVPVQPDYVLANGAVRQTFSIKIGGRTTIVEALTRIELTEMADLSAVTVLRPDPNNPLVIKLDLRGMIMTGDTSLNLTLRPGDVLRVLERGR